MKSFLSISFFLLIHLTSLAQNSFQVTVDFKSPTFNKIVIAIKNQNIHNALNDKELVQIFNGQVKNKGIYRWKSLPGYEYEAHFLDTIAGKSDMLQFTYYIIKPLGPNKQQIMLLQNEVQSQSIIATAAENQMPETTPKKVLGPDDLHLIVDDPAKPSIDFWDFMIQNLDTTDVATLKSMNKPLNVYFIIDKSGNIEKKQVRPLSSNYNSSNHLKLYSDFKNLVDLYISKVTYRPGRHKGIYVKSKASYSCCKF